MTGRKRTTTLWLSLMVGLLIVAVTGFGILEGYGLTHDDAITLSRLTWEANQSWPLLMPLLAYLAGAFQWGFTVHILWRWNPEDQSDHRG